MNNNNPRRGKSESRGEYVARMDRYAKAFAKQAGVYKKVQEERHGPKSKL